MDIWTFLTITMRVLLVAFAVLLAAIYIAFQLFQRIPRSNLQFAIWEYVVLALVAFFVGLGTNSYWGLLAFVPLVLWRILASQLFQPQRVKGSGSWLEVEWQKLMPRGLHGAHRAALEQSMNELRRIPNNAHFMIPRFAGLWVIRYMVKRTERDMKKGLPPQLRGREQEAIGWFQQIATKIEALQTSQQERFTFPFGILRIERP